MNPEKTNEQELVKSYECDPHTIENEFLLAKRQYALLTGRYQKNDVIAYRTVYDCFKRVVKKIGFPNTRFHDLRHTYAVVAIKSGDDIKTVQENLGHATAAFTLDIYGHVTEQMKHASADRMEAFIHAVSH